MRFLIQNKNRTFFVVILLFTLVLPLIIPLFNKGFFVSDDGEWMVIRFSAFYETLRSGQFPVRFLMRLNQGYGYPVSDFLYPGFMYLGVPLHVIGFSFVDTIKILMGGSIAVSVIFTYFLLKSFFSETASMMGALFYGYAPYHLYDLYTRGSVGELLALAIIPFVLWQVKKKNIFWSSLALGLLLISHNTLAVFFFCFLLFYMLVNILVAKNRHEILIRYLLIVLCGTGLSAFFWIPAVYDLQYTFFSETTVSDWRSYFSSLWLVGLQTYIVFIYVLWLFLTKRISSASHRLLFFYLFVGLFATFFATEGSAIFWKILPVSFVQFPFRFLSLSILCATFLVSFIFSQLSKRERVIGYLIFALITCVYLWKMIMPIEFIDKGEGFYATNLDTTTVRNEYMPKWVKQLPLEYPSEKVVSNDAIISNISNRANITSFNVQSKKANNIQVRTVDFPGWEAFIDGKKTVISHANPQGLIEIKVPEGIHDVQVIFKETPLRAITNLITILSFVVLCVSSIYFKRTRWF